MSTSSRSNPPKDMTLQRWEDAWTANFIPFHTRNVHKDLIIYEKQLLSNPGRIFVPLCGKTVDMKYLADKGHLVVGVEISDKAIKQFFEESKFKFEKNKDTSGRFCEYKSLDSKVILYKGDLFDMNAEVLGKFDAIWDRGSFCAINIEDREKYAKVVTGLLKIKGKYMVNIFTYNKTKFGGPPHSMNEDDILKYFGPYCTVKLLNSYDDLKPLHKEWGLNSFVVSNYLLQLNRKSASL